MTTPDSHTIRLTTGQGQDIVLPRGLSLEQALAKLPPQHPQPLAALVDNVLRELSYVPPLVMTIVTQYPDIQFEYTGGFHYIPPREDSSGTNMNVSI